MKKIDVRLRAIAALPLEKLLSRLHRLHAHGKRAVLVAFWRRYGIRECVCPRKSWELAPCTCRASRQESRIPLAAHALLLELLAPQFYAQPGEPPTFTPCMTTSTKVEVMRQRNEAGHGIRHPLDFLQRGTEISDRLERPANRLRNGAPVSGQLQIRRAA